MVAKKPAKKPASKAAVTKKAPVKKAVARKKVTRKASAKKPVVMESFRIYKNQQPFNQFRVTRQTVYWTVLLGFIAITQLYILKVQLEIAEITNSILML